MTSGDNEDPAVDDEITAALAAELRRVAGEIGQPPTKSQFDRHSDHNPQTYVSEFGSWVDALRAAELDPSKAQGGRKRVPKQDLLQELKRLESVLGRPPQVADMNALGEYSDHTYKKRFGSWNAALNAAGIECEIVNEVSNEELIDEMQRLADELGHPPRTEHMDDEGEYSSSTYQNRFGGWQGALEKAGFDPFTGISKEELMAAVDSLASELGRPPTTQEFNQLTPHSATTCKEKFGSWRKTLQATGLDPNENGQQEYSDEELIDEMQRLDDELGHTPSSSEMDDEGRYSAGVYQHRFDSWKDALDAADLDTETAGRQKYSNDELLQEIRRIADELDRPPRATDMENRGNISPATFINRFGSWENALEKAGLDPDENAAGKQYTDDELASELRHLRSEYDRPPTTSEMDDEGKYSASVYLNRFDSWKDALQAADLDPENMKSPQKYTDEELIAELHRVAEIVGGAPTTTDMEKHGNYSYATYVSRFGSWSSAVDRAGLSQQDEGD